MNDRPKGYCKQISKAMISTPKINDGHKTVVVGGIKWSLPSCMKTPFVTKSGMAGTNKGKTAIYRGINFTCFLNGQIIKTKT